MKNTIGDGMKMFRKYQLAVWRSIQNFYSHFTKVTRKCEYFSRIVEPCISKHFRPLCVTFRKWKNYIKRMFFFTFFQQLSIYYLNCYRNHI